MSYEEEQKHLQSLWQELMSDEELDGMSDGSSDNYSPDSSDNEEYDDEIVKPKKKRRELANTVDLATFSQPDLSSASTSHAPETSFDPIISIDQTIEDVIRMWSVDETEDANDIPRIPELIWTAPSGRNLKKFRFTLRDHGFVPELYEHFFDKDPYAFYSLFLNEDVIELMVSFPFLRIYMLLIPIISSYRSQKRTVMLINA